MNCVKKSINVIFNHEPALAVLWSRRYGWSFAQTPPHKKNN